MMRLAKLLFFFYVLWIVPSLLMSFVSLPIQPGSSWDSIFSFFCIGLYLLLSCSLALTIMRYVLVCQRKFPLFLSFGFSLICWCLIYFFGKRYPTDGNLIAIASTANLLVFGSIAGAALSSAVKRAAELIPLCITAAVADITSIFFGPTKEITATLSNYYEVGMTGPQPFFDTVILKVILPGYVLPVPLVGLTDWIVLVLFSSALLRLRMSDNLVNFAGRLKQYIYLPITGCGLLLSILLAQISGVFLPALPIMCLSLLLFMLLKYRKTFELRRSDIVLSVIFPAIVAITVIIAFR